jgi:hypothetical protein
LAGPVLADLAEETVVNRISLGCASRIVADGHRQLKAVDQFFLKRVFPEPTPGPLLPPPSARISVAVEANRRNIGERP